MPTTVTSGTTTESSNVISWPSRPVTLREMMRRATAAVRTGIPFNYFLFHCVRILNSFAHFLNQIN